MESIWNKRNILSTGTLLYIQIIFLTVAKTKLHNYDFIFTNRNEIYVDKDIAKIKKKKKGYAFPSSLYIWHHQGCCCTNLAQAHISFAFVSHKKIVMSYVCTSSSQFSSKTHHSMKRNICFCFPFSFPSFYTELLFFLFCL